MDEFTKQYVGKIKDLEKHTLIDFVTLLQHNEVSVMEHSYMFKLKKGDVQKCYKMFSMRSNINDLDFLKELELFNKME